MKPESDNEFYKKEAKDMVNVIQRLLMEGKELVKTNAPVVQTTFFFTALSRFVELAVICPSCKCNVQFYRCCIFSFCGSLT